MGTQITGGVDTHLDVHVAAALDEHGGLLGTASFATTTAGHGALVEWFASLGAVVLIGVEGTGRYGAGLTRHLQALGIAVVEADRPNRQRRRRSGKSDTHDAVSAARAAFAGDALGEAKTRDGNVEAIRVLRLARSSAIRDRTRALFPRLRIIRPRYGLGGKEGGTLSQTRKAPSGEGARPALVWSGRRDSNPRPQPWQGCALPTEPRPRGHRG
jgi:transposase